MYDIESRSCVDLKAVGGRRYAAHVTTQILCMGVYVDGQYHVWVPSTLYSGPLDVGLLAPTGVAVTLHRDPEFPFRAWADRPWVAHNAEGFDRFFLDRMGFTPACIDTMPIARAAGLPGGLNEIGETLFGTGKDEGKRFLKKISFGEFKDGEPVYPPLLPGYLIPVIRYCVADVEILRKLVDVVGTEYSEPEVFAAHTRINSRGIRFDRGLAAAVCRLSSEAVAAARAELETLTEGKIANPNSQKQTLAWVNAHGIYLWRPDDDSKQSLDKRLVERFLADPDGFTRGAEEAGASVEVPPEVARVLKLRQTALRQVTPKLEAAMAACDSDGRVRDTLVFHGAHTGRWSSHRVQTQNLAKGLTPVKADPDIIRDILSLYEAGKLRFGDIQAACERYRIAAEKEGRAASPTPDDILTTLIRPCFYGDPGIWVSDYAGVEARWVSWWAGQDDLTAAFGEGSDPYCSMASEVFGRPITKADARERQVGKGLVLGSGFGMGGPKFGTSCAKDGIDLAALGLTPSQCIAAYRAKYPAIPRLWKAVGAAMKETVRSGAETEVNGVRWYMDGRSMVCRLPSGRKQVYRNARIEPVVPNYCKSLGLPAIPKPSVCYDSVQRNADGPGVLWGSKGVENVAQGGCRDFMADAMTRLRDTVLLVHDEIVVETADYLTLPETMCMIPPWAGGFPLEIEWHVSPRYLKGGMPGWPSGRVRG